MKAVVTGGAGFIGSHLVDHLLGTGHQVVAVDDLSAGSVTNLERASGHPGFTFVKGSILDEPLLDDVVAGCDVVFHLAAAVGVQAIVDRPVESLQINLHGTQAVLASAVRHGCRFLFTSSSEVYGKNTAARLTEDDDQVFGSPLKSRWSYGSAKALDELLIHSGGREHAMPTVIVRLFNVIGPRQTGRYGMVLPNFVRQALGGDPITVHGEGEQTRCFVAVEEVVPALVRLIEEPRAHGHVVNLGGGEEISMEQLAHLVRRVIGSGSEIVHIPFESAYGEGFEDVPRRVPDTSRARDLIGFTVQRDLTQIVRSVAAAQTP